MRRMISALLWPGLMGTSIALNAWAMASSRPMLYFNMIYFGLAATLFTLERLMPYERTWLENDGQVAPDLLHTFLNKGVIQAFATAITSMGIARAVDPMPGELWPDTWPLAAQVALGLVVAEAGFYAAHRLAHQWRWLWRFHAVHHSVRRLWIINTGRFHFVDTIVSVALSQPLLYVAGAPQVVFLWVAAVTAFIGILTHCNVVMRWRLLGYVFNTPELHRWHHSRKAAEGNANYGENLMIFDHLFATFLFPARRPPANIGIDEPMAEGFLGQLRQPFVPETNAVAARS